MRFHHGDEGATDADFAGYPAVTLDTSHVGADRRDVFEFYDLVKDRLTHLHLSDSTTTRGDEHLPPGAGRLPLLDLGARMASDGFTGQVVLEVGIGRLPEASRADVAGECLAFARDAFSQ